MDILERHFALFNQKPQVAVKVPGIIKFFGAFSSFYKGSALVGPSNQDLSISISKSKCDFVQMVNLVTGDRKKITPMALKYKKEDKWANAVKATYSALQSTASLPLLEICMDGSLLDSKMSYLVPAVVVGLTTCLNSEYSIDISKESLVKVIFDACKFCDCECLFDYVYQLVYGLDGKYVVFDNLKHSYSLLNDPFKDSDDCIVIIDSKISQNVLLDEIIEMTNQIKNAVSSLKVVFGKTSLAGISEFAISDRSIEMDEDARRLCSYMLDEKTTCDNARQVFEKCDTSSVGRLFSRASKRIRNDIDLFCPELDWLVKRISETSFCKGVTFVPSSSGLVICAVINKANIDGFKDIFEEYDHIFGFTASLIKYEPNNNVSIYK